MDKVLEIQGKTLMFGRVGFFEHIKDATGDDPLEWMNKMFDRFKKVDGEDGPKWHVTSIVDEVVVYAYAGLNLQADITEADNVTFEKVKKWVRTLSFEQCGQIVNAAVESMIMKPTNGQEAGEQKTQPVS